MLRLKAWQRAALTLPPRRFVMSLRAPLIYSSGIPIRSLGAIPFK